MRYYILQTKIKEATDEHTDGQVIRNYMVTIKVLSSPRYFNILTSQVWNTTQT